MAKQIDHAATTPVTQMPSGWDNLIAWIVIKLLNCVGMTEVWCAGVPAHLSNLARCESWGQERKEDNEA